MVDSGYDNTTIRLKNQPEKLIIYRNIIYLCIV